MPTESLGYSFKLTVHFCQASVSENKIIYRFSQALFNNIYKQKKLNRVMLNGDDNENGFKTNRSN